MKSPKQILRAATLWEEGVSLKQLPCFLTTSMLVPKNSRKCRFSVIAVVVEDGLSVLFVRAIPSRSFDKKILKKIMGENNCESSARIVAWDDTALEMQRQNVHPLNGLFWGERQVVRL